MYGQPPPASWRYDPYTRTWVPAAPPYPAQLAHRPNSWLLAAASLLLLACLGAALLSPFATLLGLYAYYQGGGLILPGVHAGGVDLGGMTIDQAAARLHGAWNLERRIVADDGMQPIAISPSQVGLGVNPLGTAQLAYQVGRGGGLLPDMGQMARSLWAGGEIPLAVNLDADAARAGLEALSLQVGKLPVEASLQYVDGHIVPLPGELGYAINVDQALAALAADPASILLGGYLRLPLKPVAPRISDASGAVAEAERLLNSPHQIVAYDPVNNEYLAWPIAKETLAAWIVVQPGEHGLQAALDAGLLEAHLEVLSDALEPARWLEAANDSHTLAQTLQSGAPYALIVHHRPTTYTVGPGDTLLAIAWKTGVPFWKIQEANPSLDPDRLWVGQELVIPSKDELLPLPVVLNKRIIIDLGRQRLSAYQDGRQVWEHKISTGIDRSPTQPGIFQVQTHVENAYASIWDLHMPHFLGIYEAWPGFMNGIHGLPTLSNGRRLWADILGRPASYGCIILDLQAAENLYEWAEDGVVVEIVP